MWKHFQTGTKGKEEAEHTDDWQWLALPRKPPHLTIYILFLHAPRCPHHLLPFQHRSACLSLSNAAAPPAHFLPFQHQACYQAPPTQTPPEALSWAAAPAPAGQGKPTPGTTPSPAYPLPFQRRACHQAPPTQTLLVALSWAAASGPAGRGTPMPGARLGETAAAPGGPAVLHPGTADPAAGVAGGSGQRAIAGRAAGAPRRGAAGKTG